MRGVWTPRTSEGFAHVGISGRPGGCRVTPDRPACAWHVTKVHVRELAVLSYRDVARAVTH
jgi:hypothetical protein